MANSTFIPTVWSETLLSELDHEYIGVRNCNRDFEGDIKDKGSSVKIVGLGNIDIYDYSKNSDISTVQPILAEKDMTLTISQAKCFNFLIDDVDRAQAQPKLMKAAMRQAASALADVADKYVYTLYSHAAPSNVIVNDGVGPENILNTIIEARQKLLLNGVNSNTETSLEISPELASHIIRAKILNGTDNSAAIENGLLGKLFGFDVYVTNNIVKTESGSHKCIARTKRAIAFAEQLNEVETYRSATRFADGVRGLHLYGAKVVYPEEVVVIDVAL